MADPRRYENPPWLEDAIRNGPPKRTAERDARRALWAERGFERKAAIDRVPRTYRDAPLGELFQRVRDQRLRRWAEIHDASRGAVLLGPADSGKSTAAAITVLRRIRQACLDPDSSRWQRVQRVSWKTAVELERLRATDGDFRDDPPELFECKTIGLLVIQDLGNASRDSIASQVLDARYIDMERILAHFDDGRLDQFEQLLDQFLQGVRGQLPAEEDPAREIGA